MASQPAPEIQALLDEMDDQGVLPFHAHSVDGARQYLEELFTSDTEPTPVGRVRDVLADGPAGDLPVRVY